MSAIRNVCTPDEPFTPVEYREGLPVCPIAGRVGFGRARRDPLLPRLKRLRPPGRESRGRDQLEHVGGRPDRRGREVAVRRALRREVVFSKQREGRFPETTRSSRVSAGLIAEPLCLDPSGRPRSSVCASAPSRRSSRRAATCSPRSPTRRGAPGRARALQRELAELTGTTQVGDRAPRARRPSAADRHAAPHRRGARLRPRGRAPSPA